MAENPSRMPYKNYRECVNTFAVIRLPESGQCDWPLKPISVGELLSVGLHVQLKLHANLKIIATHKFDNFPCPSVVISCIEQKGNTHLIEVCMTSLSTQN